MANDTGVEGTITIEIQHNVVGFAERNEKNKAVVPDRKRKEKKRAERTEGCAS